MQLLTEIPRKNNQRRMLSSIKAKCFFALHGNRVMYESGEPEKEGIRIISEQQKMLSTLVRQKRRLYQDVAPNAASKG